MKKPIYIKVFKPLLMPSLILLHIVSSSTIHFLLLGGLFFGWLGDIFLIKPEGKRFTGGLVSFLTGHIFYIILLGQRLTEPGTSLISADSIWLIPYLIFGIAIFLYLKKDLGEMLVPVPLYMLCLIAMSYTALLYKNVSFSSNFLLPFTGSLFFLISDTLLALSTFKGEKLYSYSLIISTYGAAQFLITMGFSL
ncbi:MAG: lysoplasmalogenase [Spirochaetales bacterium]|nr:lysoplasmalogenase [Spirochaetales bacterium]